MKKIFIFCLLLGITVCVQAQTKRVLEEEFTGTHCGWCPRGMVGIELAKKQYADKIVIIAVHSPDYDASLMSQLSVDAGYGNILASVPGYPKAMIDRRHTVDPYHGYGSKGFGLPSVIDVQLQKPCEADIEVTADWENSSTEKVKATAKVKFYTPSADNYAIAYVLTADSLRSTSSNWYQLNYYYDKDNDSEIIKDPNLLPLTKESKYMKNMVYNHVPIAGAGIDNGVKESLPATIEVGKEYTNDITLEVPQLTLIDLREDCLHVVAMLINTRTKNIVNVAEVDVPEPAVTGIDILKHNGETSPIQAIYDINGRKQSSLKKGFNIIRYANGRTVKRLIP